MWHGHSLMDDQQHIQHSTQNLLLRSVWSCYRFWPPKDHHCLPGTLLPKMLVSEIPVSFIWIYIHSQLQTNIWDAFQGCDPISQNYVAFTWVSSWNNVNKWACMSSQDRNGAILLLYCECVMQGIKEKNNDSNKGAWIINTVVEWSWWRIVGLIELQEDCPFQEIIQFFLFKKHAGTFYITEIMWLGQVCLKFQLRYFVLVS